MKQLPEVCIIIPERNENPSIRTCLEAVLAQDYPQALVSVLVVDGLSTDGTREILAEYARGHPNLQVVDSPRKVVPPGFNLAVRCTQAEIILRVDGHTVIAPDYVRQCVAALRRTGADNVGGRMNAVSTTRFGWAVAFATSTPFGVGGSRFHYSQEEEWVDSVYMGAWHRRVFEKIGLFDEELVRDQDDEFNYRLRAAGGKILLDPKIKSEYTVRSSPAALWGQYYQYGYWKVRVLQKHPRQMSLRQFVPPLFVLSLLASAFLAITSIFHLPLTEHWSLNTIPFLLLTGIYLLANFAASLWTVINKARAAHSALRSALYSLLLLPLVFSILHISYGLGFLVGLVKFWNRWGDKTGKAPVWSSETVG
jgi:cellulose synthase/poly-beta-1,6-N-acetylglucosamine synthase-like glycosyltransferase